MRKEEFFPDGTLIDSWFYDTKIPTLSEMGKQYVLTNYGVLSNATVQTEKIQNIIDKAAKEGGGVIVVPEGTFLTGALFFKEGVNLYVEKGGILKGSDDIADYPLCKTRIEGETCTYYPALINVDNINGFTMCGEGTIDGNGHKSWKAFWLRREWNPDCTNKDEQRPRLVYISNCSNVLIAGLCLQNSHFWTNHLYKSHHIKFLNCKIFSPVEPVAAPSTDAIDIDVCTDVLVKNCHLEVNDDSVVLKGGKGTYADTLPENGANERIIVEDCTNTHCHSCITCGSESIHNRNIIVRRIKVSESSSLLWLKLRPDTPQHYENILVEDVEGSVIIFLRMNPWTQFYDLKEREDMPVSRAHDIIVRNCNCSCRTYFDVKADEKYILSDFTLENLNIKAKEKGNSYSEVKNIIVNNVTVTETQF